MTAPNLNKPTVNYTEEDRIQVVKTQILNWWLNRYHKKTLKKIEKLAKAHIKDTKPES